MAPPAERDCAAGAARALARGTPWLAPRSARGTSIPLMPVGRALRPGERARLVVEIVGCYREARRMLRRVPIGTAVRCLRGGTGIDAARGSERQLLAEAWRLGRAVQLTLRLAPGDTRCLTRSLVLMQLLARRGIEGKLVIGVGVEPSFSAHAWVEHAGQPVLPAGKESFGRLVEL